MCNASAFHHAPRPFIDDFNVIHIGLRRWHLMWMSRVSNIPLRSSTPEVVSPSSQNHVQSGNRLAPRRSLGSDENFLQPVSESLKALGMNSSCSSVAHEGIPEKFRFRRSKHAALVAIDSQLERPLYKQNHVLKCPLCRLSRFGIAVAIVSKVTVLQSSLVQIFVEFVQDDQRQDRTQG